MAETIIISCPGCNRKFKINGSEEMFAHQNFTCPRCEYSAPFRVIQNWARMTNGKFGKEEVQKAHTQDSTNTTPSKTKVVGGKSGTPIIYTTDKRFCQHLKIGTFTLGRLSSDSKADIRIAPDPYMSRAHATLTVSGLGTNGIRCSIKPIKREIPVIINGAPLRFEDVVMLQQGDKITLGKTTIKFDIE